VYTVYTLYLMLFAIILRDEMKVIIVDICCLEFTVVFNIEIEAPVFLTGLMLLRMLNKECKNAEVMKATYE